MYAHTSTNVLQVEPVLHGEGFFLFSWNSGAKRLMSLLIAKPGDSVDGLVCVCHTDALSFGEGQSHCDQDCNNHGDGLDWGGRVYL